MDKYQNPGHIDMQRLGELLIQAAKNPRNENLRQINATEILTAAADSLSAIACDLDAEKLRQFKPRSNAFTLCMIAEHLSRLKKAVDEGDAEVVGRFFTLYVFD